MSGKIKKTVAVDQASGTINLPQFIAAISEIADTKGISADAVVEALRESLRRAYIKFLGGGDDAVVDVKIDAKTGEIFVAQVKKVVKDVQDDYLEIDVKDANEQAGEKKYKEGDDFPIPCEVGDFSTVMAMAVKNNLRQRLAEAERTALYDIYKDRIGEMITGTVEKADDRSVSVNIGRTTVELGRREMIGDEYFKVGDPIKVYIQEVKAADQDGKPIHGPQIEVTRSSEGFLKRLFEEEIREIYDGTVIIKGIAREAGMRSKVAVASKNEDIDPTGACIGPGGSRIQKIVSQLGNGKDKEKIDIIAWSANPGLFIAESLRPANVLGVALIDPTATPFPKAVAVVRDDQLSLAIGRKGANARLANKLTGWTIDIKEESIATSDAIAFTTTEEWSKKADEEKKESERQAYAQASLTNATKRAEVAKAVAAVVAPQTGALTSEFPPEAANPAAAALAADHIAAKAAAVTVAETALAPAVQPATATAAAPVEPVAPAIQPVVAKPVEKPVAPTPVVTAVHTTTSLEELEKELEAAKGRKVEPEEPRYGGYGYSKGKMGAKSKRPHKITEEEVSHTPVDPNAAKEVLPIYSQEELDAIAKEESEAPDVAKKSDQPNEEDVDYSEFDKYYDDGSEK